MNIKLSFIILMIFPLLGISQNPENVSGVDNFSHYGYMVDTTTFEDLSKKGLSDEDICKNLGNSAYLKAKYDEATYWYAKLFDLKDTSIAPDYLYRYAQSLKSIKNYSEADNWMQKFITVKENDARAKNYNVDENYYEELMIPSKEYTVENLIAINTEQSDFAPSFFNADLVFSTGRDLETNSRTNNPYLNLYVASKNTDGKYAKATPFPNGLKSEANESSTSFSADGKTVYFTRNNYKKGSFNRDKNGISRLRIYRATFKNGVWGDVEDLPFNSDTYSIAHPSLNKEGNKLFFSSDMPGSKGASDIFMVTVNADGSFGTPENLGPKINTESKETFPFISDTGILYFASDGHPGLGGLDLFSIDIDGQGALKNLGNPINSPNDDFSLIFDENTKTGFFASNRIGGVGSDDLYILKGIDCRVNISGMVVDKDTDASLANAKIIAYNASGSIIGETVTTEAGNYELELPCQETQYSLKVNLDGYEEGTLFMLTSTDEKTITDTRIALEESTRVATIGADLVKVLSLDPIYFDLNSSYLRKDAYVNLNKVVDYLKKRPTINIKIGSHTDSREDDNYNLWLSERRANRTLEYIVLMGISADRVSGKGFGETQLINNCANGVVCSDKDHQLNRRSEFIIVE